MRARTAAGYRYGNRAALAHGRRGDTSSRYGAIGGVYLGILGSMRTERCDGGNNRRIVRHLNRMRNLLGIDSIAISGRDSHLELIE
jgi:hypothetical protein